MQTLGARILDKSIHPPAISILCCRQSDLCLILCCRQSDLCLILCCRQSDLCLILCCRQSDLCLILRCRQSDLCLILCCRQSDLCLCLGTTLQIVPCGNMPMLTKRNGGRVVIVNLQPTKHDKACHLKINAYIDDVMRRVCDTLGVTVAMESEPCVVLTSRHMGDNPRQCRIDVDASLVRYKSDCEGKDSKTAISSNDQKDSKHFTAMIALEPTSIDGKDVAPKMEAKHEGKPDSKNGLSCVEVMASPTADIKEEKPIVGSSTSGSDHIDTNRLLLNGELSLKRSTAASEVTCSKALKGIQTTLATV